MGLDHQGGASTLAALRNSALPGDLHRGAAIVIIGIDPGLSGAIARIGYVDVIRSGPGYAVADTPTGKDGRHNVFLPVEMKRLLQELISGMDCMIFLEKVHAMPKQGVASSFNFGEGYGLWQGIIVGLGLPFEKVTPQRWQKEMLAGMQGGKDASIIRAQELFPNASLNRKKDHGRADALLISEWGRRHYTGEYGRSL